MKLNNKGWGTGTMILLSLGLLIALLIAVFFISYLYGSFGNSIENRYYEDLETRLENAAAAYIVKSHIEVESEMRISLQALQENGLIDNFKDRLGNNCDGYVVIKKINLIDNFYGKINCPNYKTRNY